MGIADDAVEIRAQGWRTLAALHGLIETALERELRPATGSRSSSTRCSTRCPARTAGTCG